jgi:hypothetical protein
MRAAAQLRRRHGIVTPWAKTAKARSQRSRPRRLSPAFEGQTDTPTRMRHL